MRPFLDLMNSKPVLQWINARSQNNMGVYNVLRQSRHGLIQTAQNGAKTTVFWENLVAGKSGTEYEPILMSFANYINEQAKKEGIPEPFEPI